MLKCEPLEFLKGSTTREPHATCSNEFVTVAFSRYEITNWPLRSIRLIWQVTTKITPVPRCCRDVTLLSGTDRHARMHTVTWYYRPFALLGASHSASFKSLSSQIGELVQQLHDNELVYQPCHAIASP